MKNLSEVYNAVAKVADTHPHQQIDVAVTKRVCAKMFDVLLPMCEEDRQRVLKWGLAAARKRQKRGKGAKR